MDQLILAASECDVANEVVCTPNNVLELFEFNSVAFVWIPFAAIATIALVYFALRKPKLVPGRYQAGVESLMNLVTDGIAKDVIGPDGVKYVPYLLSLFFFIWIGNLMELMPWHQLPYHLADGAAAAFLALLTWVIFVAVGIMEAGPRLLRPSAMATWSAESPSSRLWGSSSLSPPSSFGLSRWQSGCLPTWLPAT